MYYFLHDASGRLASIGTVLADPMPKSLFVIEVDEEEYAKAGSIYHYWDSDRLSFVEVESVE